MVRIFQSGNESSTHRSHFSRPCPSANVSVLTSSHETVLSENQGSEPFMSNLFADQGLYKWCFINPWTLRTAKLGYLVSISITIGTTSEQKRRLTRIFRRGCTKAGGRSRAGSTTGVTFIFAIDKIQTGQPLCQRVIASSIARVATTAVT